MCAAAENEPALSGDLEFPRQEPIGTVQQIQVPPAKSSHVLRICYMKSKCK